MMKKTTLLALFLVLALLFTACGTTAVTTAAPETAAPTQTTAVPTTEAYESVSFHVYSLKGPTSMGLVKLLDDSDNGLSKNTYLSTMAVAADEVTGALVAGTADIAMLPANAAATLFQKAGGFSVVAINTLGVLYLVENGESIQSVADLAGKTVYLTGKGTTPEYTLRSILAANGIEDQVTLEFKSEPTEIVSAMAQDTALVGLLPQPFVTAALLQNESLRVALDLNTAWSALGDGSTLVTGVTVVRNEILEQYPEQVAAFLDEYAASVEYVNANPAEAAVQIEALGIVAKAAIAEKALPECNLVCITGSEMQAALSGYLEALYAQNPAAVGGALPESAFYYLP